MNHLARIVNEFNELTKIARKWDDLSYDEQKGYLSRHPLSRRKMTAKPEGQEKSREKPSSRKKLVKEKLKERLTAKPESGEKSREKLLSRKKLLKEIKKAPTEDSSDRDRDPYMENIKSGVTWRKNKIEELKKSLPKDQQEWAPYLVQINRKTGDSFANDIKDVYKNKPIIHEAGDKEKFLVPSVLTQYNNSGRRYLVDEANIDNVNLLAFDSVEEAKAFIDEEPAMAEKFTLRKQIKSVTEDIFNSYKKTIVPEGYHHLPHMYIADSLAKTPQEDVYGTRHNSDNTTEQYLMTKGQSFNLSSSDHKKIDNAINNPESSLEDVKFAIDNLDKFTADVKKYKEINKGSDYDVEKAQEFLDKKDKIKKALSDSVEKLKLKNKLIDKHGYETKDDIKLPEGFEFRDKPKLSYEAYNDIIIGNDDMEIHLSLSKPDGNGKHGGEVYYKVPGKDGTYMLGRRGFDSGISTSWDENQDVNQLIQEKINEVKAKQDKISQMTVQIPVKGSRQGGGTWSVTPERFEEMKNELKSGKQLTFSPSGMGTGYYVSARPSRYGDKAAKELDDMFGMPLYIDTYDHD